MGACFCNENGKDKKKIDKIDNPEVNLKNNIKYNYRIKKLFHLREIFLLLFPQKMKLLKTIHTKKQIQKIKSMKKKKIKKENFLKKKKIN